MTMIDHQIDPVPTAFLRRFFFAFGLQLLYSLVTEVTRDANGRP